MESVAKQLDMSGRTLQRLLIETRMPLKEIAQQTGFAEPSSLSRAVRNWFGQSPGQFRKQNRR